MFHLRSYLLSSLSPRQMQEWSHHTAWLPWQTVVLSNLWATLGLNVLSAAVYHQCWGTADTWEEAVGACHWFTAWIARLMGSRDGAATDYSASRALPMNWARKAIYWVERNGISNYNNGDDWQQMIMFCCHRRRHESGGGLVTSELWQEEWDWQNKWRSRTKVRIIIVPCRGWSMGDILCWFVMRK